MIDKTNLDGPSGKLDPDGGFRLQVELVPCEAGQQVGLAHTGVADQDNWWTNYFQTRPRTELTLFQNLASLAWLHDDNGGVQAIQLSQ